eukprot:13684424-Alexandrium_andersonii.AAC.1
MQRAPQARGLRRSPPSPARPTPLTHGGRVLRASSFGSTSRMLQGSPIPAVSLRSPSAPSWRSCALQAIGQHPRCCPSQSRN